jgi:ribonuclease HII
MSGNSRTIIGVDEAGYGPLLGPLVLGMSAFRIQGGASDLSERLAAICGSRRPVPVDDSKKLYKGGLGSLERSVLAFSEVARDADVPDRPREGPAWGLAWPPSLPVAIQEEEQAYATAVLSDGLAGASVEVLALATRTVGVREFNEGVERTDSKAAVLFSAAMELAGAWFDVEGEVTVRIDRHGGRKRYSPLLAAAFPGRHHWILREEPDISAYRFPRTGGDVTVSFETKADSRHLPVALASMAAKYVRELHMRAFNGYFFARDPSLRPTAGYVQDGRRWLQESSALRARLSITDEALVRRR